MTNARRVRLHGGRRDQPQHFRLGEHLADQRRGSVGRHEVCRRLKAARVAEFDYVRYFAKTVSPKANDP